MPSDRLRESFTIPLSEYLRSTRAVLYDRGITSTEEPNPMATTLTRWDPFSELASMRGMFDRLFDSPFPRLAQRAGEEIEATTLGMDVYETGNEFVVKASIPGVDPKDVEITVEDDVLTIKGESKHEEEVKEDQYVRRELRYGSFHRVLRLPPTVEAEKADARFENGILKLTLPKRPEARARSLKITPQGVIEGEKAPAPEAPAAN